MSLESFTHAYKVVMLDDLFLSDREYFRSGESEDAIEPDRDHYKPENLGACARIAIDRECKAFYEAHADRWALHITDDHAGDRFYFNRNRHGVGFWDCDDLPKHAQHALSDAAQDAGERWYYRGDDTRIYQAGAEDSHLRVVGT